MSASRLLGLKHSTYIENSIFGTYYFTYRHCKRACNRPLATLAENWWIPPLSSGIYQVVIWILSISNQKLWRHMSPLKIKCKYVRYLIHAFSRYAFSIAILDKKGGIRTIYGIWYVTVFQIHWIECHICSQNDQTMWYVWSIDFAMAVVQMNAHAR